jgi:AAA domain
MSTIPFPRSRDTYRQPTDAELDPYRDDPSEEESRPKRAVKLTPGSAFALRRTRWVWDGRIALGGLSLLAGREGLGKSTIAYWMCARISRGELPGEFLGKPKSVLVCATEDSWNHTIAPRLHAAGADLDRIFQIEMMDEDEMTDEISLPRDLKATGEAAVEVNAGLLLLDPLTSRLSSSLDTHKDSEVRQALEPLTRMADSSKIAVLGLIHLNKGSGTDPVNAVMGSRAFTAVARSVSVVVPDPSDPDEHRRLFGTPKNNLGRIDLPLLPYTVVGHAIDSDDGTIWTGRVEWGEPVTGTIGSAMAMANEDSGVRSAVDEAGDWLEDWLATQGGEAPSKDVYRAGAKENHSQDSLKRAMKRKDSISYRSEGMPRTTVWFLTDWAAGVGS